MALLNPASLTLADDTPVEDTDYHFNWNYRAQAKGAKRADVLLTDLTQMTPSLKVNTIETTKISSETVKDYNLFILTDCYDVMAVDGWDIMCRENDIAFILANCVGCFGSLFVDFGKHRILDKYYLPMKSQFYVKSITNAKPGKVELYPFNRPSFLEDGDFVSFTGVTGMVEVNGNGSDPRPIKIIDKETFTIENTQSFNKYTGGGTINYEKVPSTINFGSFKENLSKPRFKSVDNNKNSFLIEMHVCMLIYFELREELEIDVSHACDQFTEEDIEQHIADVIVSRDIIKSLISTNKLDTQKLKKAVFQMVFVRKAQLLPMTNLIANLAAFQVITLSGKLIPVNQWLYFDMTQSYPDSFVESLGSASFDPLRQHYDSFKVMKSNLIDHSSLRYKWLLTQSGHYWMCDQGHGGRQAACSHGNCLWTERMHYTRRCSECVPHDAYCQLYT
mgnify:CR=1 FL=1